jgi:hypothetical protein
VAQQIQREKAFEASQKIGANRLSKRQRGDATKTQTSAVEKEGDKQESKEEVPNVISSMFN